MGFVQEEKLRPLSHIKPAVQWMNAPPAKTGFIQLCKMVVNQKTLGVEVFQQFRQRAWAAFPEQWIIVGRVPVKQRRIFMGNLAKAFKEGRLVGHQVGNVFKGTPFTWLYGRP